MMLVDSGRAPTAYRPSSYDWLTWSSYHPPTHNQGVNTVHVDDHSEWFRLERLYNGKSNIPYYSSRP